MKTGKKDRDKQNNGGFTLVELIVVMAIMAIMAGGVSYSVALVFSRDANRCAITLNDSISEARTLSMSKKGEYVLKITTDSEGMYIATITGTKTDSEGASSVEYDRTYSLEGDESKRISSINYDGTPITSSNEVSIIFDKTKGNVKSVNGTSVADSILVFDITPTRGTKTDKVQLVAGTGKHTVGDF